MSCWTDAELSQIVLLYSRHPNLWNRCHPRYDDLKQRYESYGRILAALSSPRRATVSEVIAKLRDLRCGYVEELKKLLRARRKGRVYRPECEWFWTMHGFLYDHLDPDERLAEIANSTDGNSTLSEGIRCCGVQRAAKDVESDEEDVEDEGNTADCRELEALQRGEVLFVRSPTVLRSTKMNTVYEIPRRRKPREIEEVVERVDGMRYEESKSTKKQRNGEKRPRSPTARKPPLHGRLETNVARSAGVGISREEARRSVEATRGWPDGCDFSSVSPTLKFRAPAPPPHGVSRRQRSYDPRGGRAKPGPVNWEPKLREAWTGSNCAAVSSCPHCDNRRREEGLNRVIEGCITAARKSLSRISRERPDLDGSRVTNVERGTRDDEAKVEVERRESSTPCPKRTGIQVICLGDDDIDDNLLKILEDTTVRLCPVDVDCASGVCGASDCKTPMRALQACCRTCSDVTQPVKSQGQDEIENESDVLKEARKELNEIGKLYDESKYVTFAGDDQRKFSTKEDRKAEDDASSSDLAKSREDRGTDAAREDASEQTDAAPWGRDASSLIADQDQSPSTLEPENDDSNLQYEVDRVEDDIIE